MRTLLTPVFVTGVAAAGLLAQQRAQDPIRLEVNYVEVDAIVTDSGNRFVSDLQKGDFQVLEDDRPQIVTDFSTVEHPFPAPRNIASAPFIIEPDVSTNARPLEGRLYVLVLDDLHTSPMRNPLVKAAARRFIHRHVGEGDLVAVVHTSGTAQGTQDFTGNRARLERAVDQFTGRKLPPSTFGRLSAYEQNVIAGRATAPATDPQSVERANNARSVLLTVRTLADSLAGIRGRRKAMLFISEGIDYDLRDYVNHRDSLAVHAAVRAAVSSAARANVTIYTIDPRGLASTGDDLIDVARVPLNPHLNLGPGTLQDELTLSQDSLRVLAEETGGFAVVTANDFPAAFDRLVVENSRYYVLGYYSSNDRRDDRFRRIEVRVSRPELTVRARKGYVAARAVTASNKYDIGSGSPEVREALDRALPTSGLALRASALALKGATTEATVPVTIEAGGPGFSFAKKDGRFQEIVELSVAALDYNGKVRANDHTAITIELTPERYSRFADTGFRTFSKLALLPGRYQLRIAVRAGGSGSLGTVFHEVDVPDFASASFTMSSLLVTSVEKNTVPSARLEAVKDRLPVFPSTAREFTVGDELVVFAEVYDRAAVPHRVDVTATVRDQNGRVMFEHRQENSSGGRDAPGGFGYVARIRLNDLTAGVYELHVGAVSRLTNGGQAHRQVQFRIRR